MGSPTDARPAVSDIVYGLRDIFKKYTRSTRKHAWKAVTRPEGEKMIDKIINNPTVPIVGLPKLLNFKEWLELNEGGYDSFAQRQKKQATTGLRTPSGIPVPPPPPGKGYTSIIKAPPPPRKA